MKQDLVQFYGNQVKTLTEEISRLKRYNTVFITSELLAFGLIVLCVIAYFAWEGGAASLGLAVLFLWGYFMVRRMDIRQGNKVEEKENLRMVYQKELAYMDGDFSGFADGEAYIDPHHDYTFDMDIFGRDSLFNRINRTITTGGSDGLAGELAQTVPGNIAEITAQREAIGELAAREELRGRFRALGQNGIIDTQKILETLKAMKETVLPSFALSPVSLVLVILAGTGFVVTVILSILGLLRSSVPVTWGILQFFAVSFLCASSIRSMNNVVGKVHRQLKAYIDIIGLICHSGLKSEENLRIIRQFSADGTNAVEAFRELKGILDQLDRRGNLIGLILFNTLLLSDYFLIRRFLQWQKRYLLRIEDWIVAVNRFDTLVSMATFRYNEPTATEATLVDTDEVVYRAEGIWHPFLGDKAVRNDFRIDNNHYYIITGANMAGKSTFLRALGVNYILAICGMPVFCNRLTVSLFSLFSSMRTTDDLTHGLSYFKAELLRLQQLIAHCKQHRHTLMILDEILKGTNSLDKLNGSRLFLQAISTLPVSGVIATHDLELSKMADEDPGRFHNYCFEIRLSDEITYTYKISEGVARNQNATFLLKKILADIKS